VEYCERRNESTSSIKHREFIDEMKEYELLKDSAAWMELRFLGKEA
jgi:hypothetical protein